MPCHGRGITFCTLAEPAITAGVDGGTVILLFPSSALSQGYHYARAVAVTFIALLNTGGRVVRGALSADAQTASNCWKPPVPVRRIPSQCEQVAIFTSSPALRNRRIRLCMPQNAVS